MSNKSLVIAALVIVGVVGLLVVLNLARDTSKEGVDLNNIDLSQTNKPEEKATPSFKRYSAPPQLVIDQRKTYQAVLKTSKGDIKVDLFTKETPKTVNNFVFLAKDGFYNSTRFHRIIKGFMIQGGDPLGNGTGGPGYTFEDEPITRDYKKGVIAMANRGADTNGSQFFIMHADYPLQKNYVIFGQVVEGLEVVDAIANTPVKRSPGGEMSLPTEDTLISAVEIVEK